MRTRPRRGFTLMEILVVMVILAILASTVAAVLINMRSKARIERTRNQIALIVSALEKYRDEFGAYPPDTGYGLAMETSPGTYDAGSLWRHLARRVKHPRTGKLLGPFLEWPQEDRARYADALAGESFYLADPWGMPYGYVGDPRRAVRNPGGVDVFSCGPDGVTASDKPGAAANLAYDGLDNDKDGATDDSAELGAAARNGTEDDDVNGWLSH